MHLDEKSLFSLLERIQSDIFRANRIDQLEMFFSGFSSEKYLGTCKDRLPHIDKSTILIIGASQLNLNQIMKLAKDNGIDPRRVECVLDYSKLTSYSFNKLEYNTGYRCVIVGPIPHSVPEKGKYESIISKMQMETEKYPEIIIVKTESGHLKITKSALSKIFELLD